MFDRFITTKINVNKYYQLNDNIKFAAALLVWRHS